LSGVSSELAQAQVRIVRPALYERGKRIDDPGPADGEGFVAPPIPPITSGFPESSAPGTRSKGPSVAFPAGNGQEINFPTGTPPTLAPQQPGLVLGGTATPLPSPPSTTLPSIPQAVPGGGSGPILSPGPVAPLTSTPIPQNGPSFISPITTDSRRGVGVPREGLLHPSSPGGAGGVRAMPPGGLIGGTPGIGLGQPTGGRPGTRRINPVGGVIGGDQISQPRASSPGSNTEHAGNLATSYGQANGRKSGRQSETDGVASHWDPDNPWETADGVDPVVLPTRERRIDPGPAIGLS